MKSFTDTSRVIPNLYDFLSSVEHKVILVNKHFGFLLTSTVWTECFGWTIPLNLQVFGVSIMKSMLSSFTCEQKERLKLSLFLVSTFASFIFYSLSLPLVLSPQFPREEG